MQTELANFFWSCCLLRMLEAPEPAHLTSGQRGASPSNGDTFAAHSAIFIPAAQTQSQRQGHKYRQTARGYSSIHPSIITPAAQSRRPKIWPLTLPASRPKPFKSKLISTAALSTFLLSNPLDRISSPSVLLSFCYLLLCPITQILLILSTTTRLERTSSMLSSVRSSE